MFVISKLIGYLLNPLIWVVICLILAYLSKKGRFHWLKSGLLILIIFSNPWLADMTMGLLESEYRELPDKPYEIGIMLTGATNPFIDAPENVHFESGADRFTTLVKLYHTGEVNKILITGGSGLLIGDYEESGLLGKLATQMGIPEEDIIIENNARNTYENARYSKHILDSLSIDKGILVTSAYHMPRALGCYKKLQIDVYPYSTDFRSASIGMRSWLPTIESLEQWRTILHEVFGLVYYRLAGYI